MAVREIKTSITLDGEQQFRQAIAAANKELRVSQSELKAVASAYDLSGNKMQMLADKQRILGDMVNQQENTTNALRRNLKELEDAYDRAGKGVEEYRQKLRQAENTGDQGEIERAANALRNAEAAYEQAARKVQDYQIQVNNAEDKLNRFKRAQQDADREVEELGRDSIKAGRQIEEGIGESAEAAEKDVRNLVSTLKDDLSAIRANTTFSAIGSLWDMATDAYSSVSGFVSGTQEYRKQLSFLKQNAETYDIDFKFLKGQLIEAQTLTGDASSAVEGLSNLLATEMDTAQITNAVDLLGGAVIKFPDTLKFESLADGLQETIAQGSATGQFGELLERLGVDVNEFNAALEESETTSGDIEIALAYLASHGLKDVADKWKETNGDMVNAMETQSELEQELATFGGTLEKYITTPVKSVFLDAVKWVNQEISAWESDPETYAEELPGRIGEATKRTNQLIRHQFGELVKPIAPWEVAGNVLSLAGQDEASESAKEIGRQSAEMFKETIEAINPVTIGTNIGNWLFSDKGKDTSFINDMFARLAVARNNYGEIQTENSRAAIDAAIDFAQNWEGPWGMGGNKNDAQIAGQEAAQSYMDGWDSIIIDPSKAVEAGDFEEAGADAGDTLNKSMITEMESAAEQARLAGENAALSFGSGLASKVSYISAQASALAAAAGARLNATRGGGASIVLNMDGREVARGLVPYNSEALAVQMGWS